MRINTKRCLSRDSRGCTGLPYISVLAQLRRSVLLVPPSGSRSFMRNGEEIGKRIAQLTAQCLPEDVAALAIEARRADAPATRCRSLLLRELARHPLIKGPTAALVQDHGPGAAACR